MTDDGRSREYTVITATERTMAIIELMTCSSEGASVTRVADYLRVNKGMAHRLLTSRDRST